MALEFSGIENIGEFYSGHYLSAVLEGDLKATFAKWKQAKEEEGQRPPNEALAGLANRYFTARAKAEDESDPAARLALAQDFHAYLLEALGYQRQPALEPLGGNEVVPVHLALRRDGNPFLWVLDAPFSARNDEDPLASPPLPEELLNSGKETEGASLPKSSQRKDVPATWREILDERLFRLERPPRWVLFLAGSEALLIERHKWLQGKYLRFDLGELFGRKQAAALRAVAGLLHRDVLAPEAGLCLHDTLDENSHKHAYAVSGDLKHGVRRAVELLANEAVYYRREVQKQGVFNDDEFAAKLTAEGLTWLYRLLFLFYVEARGAELGAVPMQSNAYRKGYSLETLRDLELVPLTSEHARNGYFLHDSLKTLFHILNMGFPQLDTEHGGMDAFGRQMLTANDMWIDALNSPLFDDDRLELLKGVRFRNHILQDVLQLLSLSAQKKKKTRGRISYAQLGINQLGAVYEGLLSYTGFFATEDLYEVASEKDCKQLSGKPAAEREALKTYFVPASRIGDYTEGEIVKDENEKKVVHKKGTFIFRLAGRNREKSASYYTPEVLTQCLVKYALKELLWEEGEEEEKPRRKKTADEILALTICEPAMGSSAFLIEAVDQLADAYLEARQEEDGETIPPEDYQREKRRVKARLATNNCYGVDLNPTAVELAKVSLWLATLHEEGKCPWFGLRLATGNSLVGARREVFKTAAVTRKGTKDDPNWLGLVPEPIPLNHGDDDPTPDEVDRANWTAPPRPKGTIYHFLLPAEGMAAFDKDKVIKQLAPESVKRIKEWRKEFCKPFNKKDAERLEQISDAVDRLFAQVVRERVLATQETSDRIPVWGEPPSAKQADLLVRDQEKVAASLEDGSSAYRRLKLAMDAWCALWFWPIEEAGLLPDRVTWLAQMELILKGQVTHESVWKQQNLFAEFSPMTQADLVTSQVLQGDVEKQREAGAERLKRLQGLSNAFRERRADYFDECGLADIDTILESDAGLRAAQRVADRLHFHHWPLRFAEVFGESGGFDLILGNPPWVKVNWNEAGTLADYEPSLDIRKVSASDVARLRSDILANDAAERVYLSEIAETTGTQQFLSALHNYPLLDGLQANLYRCFVVLAWSIGSSTGVNAFLHPESLYNDPRAGLLRSALYPRLVLCARFVNEMKLFSEVGNQLRYTLNCYRNLPSRIAGRLITNLVHPRTIESSWSHDGLGAVPRIKDDAGNWDTRGHARRLVRITEDRLRLFATLIDTEDTLASHARLLMVHSDDLVGILEKFARRPKLLGVKRSDYYPSVLWDETNAQKDGTIRRETQRPGSLSGVIVQGPHFYTANPLNKSPNEVCTTSRAYTEIDLTAVGEQYVPRTNYVPALSQSEYIARIPKWRGRPISDYPRVIARSMIVSSNERTLIAALLPPGVLHVITCFSLAMAPERIGRVCLALISLPIDFFVKVTGKTHFLDDVASKLPQPEFASLEDYGVLRAMALNCVSSAYSGIWNDTYRSSYAKDRFTICDRRLTDFALLTREWSAAVPFRSDFERRQALVECDVIVAMALGLSLSELVSAYSVQFPVMQQYECERLYDQSGRIVATSKTAAGNPAVSLVELAATLKEQAGFDVHAEYHPDGSNTQELRKQKIRLGKKEADVVGVSERCTMADLLAETEVRWSDEDHPEGRPVRLVGLRYTDPGLEPRMERVYPTPWTRCDREADYHQAWAEFERRLGKKMPEDMA